MLAQYGHDSGKCVAKRGRWDCDGEGAGVVWS